VSTEPTKIGKYRVLHELGRGTSSRVYLGRDPFADRTVAIKVMLKDSQLGNTESNQLERVFQNEASLAGRLTHPHIIEILDADVGNELPYIVMEYVDGRTLEHFCKVDTLMPLNRVVELAFKCGLALDFASRKGIIHRDIKPANIMMGENGDIKLTDFGIALHSDGEKTQLQGVGSPTYMSPEQIQEGKLTYQTDIYALGVVMYRLLTGKLPFVASNNTSLAYQIVNVEPVAPSVHRPDLPADFDRIVMKAIAKDVSQRYQTWSNFTQDLGQVSKDLSVKTDTIDETEKFSAIQKIRYFSEFAELEIWEMVRIATFRRIQPKETIVPEGEVCESFFLIVSGEARVRKGGESVSVLGDGDCFGEMPYFEERGPRTSSVVAITPMTIVEVNSTALRLASEACQQQFNRGFLRILLDRIDRLSKANMQLIKAARNKPESKESKVPEAGKPAAGKPAAGMPEAGKPVTGKPVTGKPVTGKPVTGKPEARETEIKGSDSTKPETLDLKIELPESKKPETQELKIELSESKKPETQELKIELSESKKPESQELKIEIPESKPSESKKPESQGLKLEDPESSKPASQGLKLEDPESPKPASQGLNLENPESKKPESQGLKLELLDPNKPESKTTDLEQPQSIAQTR